MSRKYMDETTFEILYQNLCMGVSQEELANRYSYDSRFDSQGKISKCVIENGFHTGVPGFQARLYRKHLLGLTREEFRTYLVGYNGSRETKLEDFVAHMEKMNRSRAMQQPATPNPNQVMQNRSQQSWQQPMPPNMPPQYSNPAPHPQPAQLTIGELRRKSPDELTPQQLATLKSAGYVYDPRRGWRSPEEMAEERARAEHEAKMRAAGYVKVGNPFAGNVRWMSQEEINAHAAQTLAMEKTRLAELAISQINAGQLEFDVVLLGHIAPGKKPQRTYDVIIPEYKKRLLPFLPEKMDARVESYPSFHLLQTQTYGEDIADVNKTYLIPRGYRISTIRVIEKYSRNAAGLPDIFLVTLTIEPLNINNVSAGSSKTCPQCGGINMPDSIFCSRCGMRFE